MATNISSRELERKQAAFLDKYGPPVAASEAPKFLRMLLYGPPNVGKTVTACSLGSKNLLLAADENWVALHNHPELLEKTSVIPNQGLEHFANLVDAVGNGYQGYTGFDNFVIDTYPQLVEDILDKLTFDSEYFATGGNAKNYREKATFIDGFTLNGKSEIPLAGGPDYNIIRGYFRPILSALNTLPMHVIYIAHEREAKNHIANTTQIVRANLPEQTYQSLHRRCNITGRMDVNKEGQRSITFKKTAGVDAGAKVANLNDRTMTVEKFISEIQDWSNS